jgi:hypothetical protein
VLIPNTPNLPPLPLRPMSLRPRTGASSWTASESRRGYLVLAEPLYFLSLWKSAAVGALNPQTLFKSVSRQLHYCPRSASKRYYDVKSLLLTPIKSVLICNISAKSIGSLRSSSSISLSPRLLGCGVQRACGGWSASHVLASCTCCHHLASLLCCCREQL